MPRGSEFQDVVARSYLVCLIEASEGAIPRGLKTHPDPWAINTRNLAQSIALYENFLNIDKEDRSDYERSL